MNAFHLTVEVNGVNHETDVEPRRLLADFLRDDLHLRGTRVGCEHGVCGSCTVLMDGQPVRSCTVLAVQANNSRIETVESLQQDGQLHPLQSSFSKCHALQCGFCTSGFLMTLKPLYDDDEVTLDATSAREAISGNICRCTGYQQIVEATVEAFNCRAHDD
ncbi:6-hydroxypseudooxynicotine dehydrogenase complex subunit beta [Arthrobacter nitrophenolicus]|uniref:Ketone dehydrogenase small subunit n=2 Tax=Arthrobacter nitrophenolicus TaxID=683150 RepID=L8TQ78_9MICC|nr:MULTISPECIES: 6-hydroxypseudooxynicotine dehydrogenase complex subunit beta [Micrococcaceae]ELT44877.1 ketone dehydrogenase small subunit [Arthrobacter nitrophenolicus]TPV48066.1 (2Fe-2S)-binding protein [Pseudarthrobacter phenanthrenivorans]